MLYNPKKFSMREKLQRKINLQKHGSTQLICPKGSTRGGDLRQLNSGYLLFQIKLIFRLFFFSPFHLVIADKFDTLS